MSLNGADHVAPMAMNLKRIYAFCGLSQSGVSTFEDALCDFYGSAAYRLQVTALLAQARDKFDMDLSLSPEKQQVEMLIHEIGAFSQASQWVKILIIQGVDCFQMASWLKIWLGEVLQIVFINTNMAQRFSRSVTISHDQLRLNDEHNREKSTGVILRLSDLCLDNSGQIEGPMEKLRDFVNLLTEDGEPKWEQQWTSQQQRPEGQEQQVFHGLSKPQQRNGPQMFQGDWLVRNQEVQQTLQQHRSLPPQQQQQAAYQPLEYQPLSVFPHQQALPQFLQHQPQLQHQEPAQYFWVNQPYGIHQQGLQQNFQAPLPPQQQPDPHPVYHPLNYQPLVENYQQNLLWQSQPQPQPYQEAIYQFPENQPRPEFFPHQQAFPHVPQPHPLFQQQHLQSLGGLPETQPQCPQQPQQHQYHQPITHPIRRRWRRRRRTPRRTLPQPEIQPQPQPPPQSPPQQPSKPPNPPPQQPSPPETPSPQQPSAPPTQQPSTPPTPPPQPEPEPQLSPSPPPLPSAPQEPLPNLTGSFSRSASPLPEPSALLELSDLMEGWWKPLEAFNQGPDEEMESGLGMDERAGDGGAGDPRAGDRMVGDGRAGDGRVGNRRASDGG